MKRETAAHLRHSSLWVTGLERGALSEYCRKTLFRIPGVSVQEMLPEGRILAWKIRASDSSSYFGCQLALWSWTNHFNRDTEGDLRLLHSAILHSSLARTSVQQGFHVKWQRYVPGLADSCPLFLPENNSASLLLGPLSFFKKFIYFIYFWLHWVFVAARGLSLVVASGSYSSLRCAGFSLRWLLAAEHGL